MSTTVEQNEKPEARGGKAKGRGGSEESDGTRPSGSGLSKGMGSSATEPSEVLGKNKATKKEKKDGNKRSKKSKKEVSKPLTKVIIRRLPPSMDEETFRRQIEPMPEHDDFYFVSGDWSLGKNASSRAYINFTRAEDIYLFKDKFDGYIFVDAKGVEFPAVVEFAPFQELPRNRSRKKDVKCATIETDTHFIAFKEALEAEEKDTAGKSKSKLEYTYKIKDEEKITSTPLLEYIAQKKQEKRDEKRKKMEEKKKQRKEERQKKNVKSIPDAIKEENTKEEEIVVRTVPSRLDPNQGKKDFGRKGNDKFEGSKDGRDKEKRQRNRKEKDKERGRVDKDVGGDGEPEKGLSRKQERDRLRKEKDKARKQEEKDKKATGELPKKEKESGPKQENPPQKTSPVEAPKKEVKKYSERRKETRARAETRLAELEDKDRQDALNAAGSDEFKSITVPKVDIKKSILTPHVAPFIPKEKSTIILGESSFTLPPAFPQKANVTNSPQAQEDLATTETNQEASPPPETPAPDSSSSDKKVEIDEKLKEAREARKIRNKNRPSIEIYQPRKRLVPGSAATGWKEPKSEDDNKTKEKTDSDRSSDKSVKPGGSHGQKDRGKRHKLTKKASDKERPKDRRTRRRNSGEIEKETGSRKTSREEPQPPAEPVTTSQVTEKPIEKIDVTEVVEVMEGIKLDS
ncbi:regulator of nonsense transcripts 3B [Armigeres subalbatus]|uniref:regulator of nonsense transcripts 3B n=1 Tax=Armigeres subalbatus TaxID=124917 RepID=UPI002ED097D9